ncbi:phosphoserine phosphatase SerB [Schaalia sp. lx-260]|uniref:phosphoserine phosphatase SerB n=1 Tax=Schaalia sp. lx-260 TaxID=2899082 RepID=UPI003FA6F20C
MSQRFLYISRKPTHIRPPQGWIVRPVAGVNLPGSDTWYGLVCESPILEGALPAKSMFSWIQAHSDEPLDPQSSVFMVPETLHKGPDFIVTDVDSTLICEEVIEELARWAGTYEEVARITAEAMNGERDFAQSLRARVATLAGISHSVFHDVLEHIHPRPGAQLLIDEAHHHGASFAVVSGGFTEVVAPLCERMGIDYWIANRLEVANGYLTGRVVGEIVTADVKVRMMQQWAAQQGIPLNHVLAVGDGANDIPMLSHAGLGVAFCAKPTVQDQVHAHINYPRLDILTALWA